MEKAQIEQLLHRYLDGTISDADRRLLEELVIGNREPGTVADALQVLLASTEGHPSQVPVEWEAIPDTIIAIERRAATPVRPIPMKRWWVAASIMLVLATGTYFWINGKRNVESTHGAGTIADIAPGTNRAILTIGDQAIQLANGKKGIAVGSAITYDDGERIAETNQTLQLSTPRGGQYEAVLPDGTKVWLNAGSSIRFPPKFSGKKRIVEVTGEVYMEVTRNPDQPFAVIARGAEIQVLGTSFNVNAYENEEAIATTLVSGSVKVVVTGNSERYEQGARIQDQTRSERNGVILKPGQQAKAGLRSMTVQLADIDQVMAWKNGLFDFNGLTFKEIMPQLERWYDIRVEYENNKILETRLAGKMTRGVSLNGLLERFEKMGIYYKLENRTLILLNE